MPNYSVQFPDQESILHSFMRKSPVRDTDAYPHVAGPDTMVNLGNWRLWDNAGLHMPTATRRQKLCTLQASLVNRVHTVAREWLIVLSETLSMGTATPSKRLADRCSVFEQ